MRILSDEVVTICLVSIQQILNEKKDPHISVC